MLKKDGILWISTPNYNSAYARMEKFTHCMWHTLNHYTYVSFESLNKLLQNINMKVIHYDTLSGQGHTRLNHRLLTAGGVNVSRRTSSTPPSVALPAAKIRRLRSKGVLHLRFVILQGIGTRRTGVRQVTVTTQNRKSVVQNRVCPCPLRV